MATSAEDSKIEIARNAMSVLPGDDPELPIWLNNLCRLLHEKFERTKAIESINEAIELTYFAASVTSEQHPDRARLLINLGSYLASRYSVSEAKDDIDEAIRVTREAIGAIKWANPDLIGGVRNLCKHLKVRSVFAGSTEDWDEAILFLRQLIEIPSRTNGYRTEEVLMLSCELNERFTKTGNIDDLAEAIRLCRETLGNISADHPQHDTLLGSLIIQLRAKYEHTKEEKYLAEAVHLTENLTKDGPQRAEKLVNMGNLLKDAYVSSGSIKDLEDAVLMIREALGLTPKEDPRYPERLSELAIYLCERSNLTGSIEDLNEAINVSQEAVEITPKNQLNRAVRLNVLAFALSSRYSRTVALADLENAIQINRETLEIFSRGTYYHTAELGNLGNRLGHKFRRTQSIEVLNEAIEFSQQAVDNCQKGSRDWVLWYSNLGLRLFDKYQLSHSIDDLNRAIRVDELILELIPKSHRSYWEIVNNYAGKLQDKSNHTGLPQDENNTLKAFFKAAEACPESHPARAKVYTNVGILLYRQYTALDTKDSFEMCKRFLGGALAQKEGHPNCRVEAGRLLLSCFDLSQEAEADEAYIVARITMRLIPLLVPPSLQNKDKHFLLSDIVGLASDAAAAALSSGNGLIAAIQFLESGRGVMAASLQDFRVDISPLRKRHPELADRFLRLRDQLDSASLEGDINSTCKNNIISQAKANERYSASDQMPTLLEEIRSKPGFEWFLLPASEDEIKTAAAKGAIIIINVCHRRCDAFIITESEIQLLELPHISAGDIFEHAKDAQSLYCLGWLWDAIVNPVLSSLGHCSIPTDGIMPHVWWIPTGPLVGLPLHAAGHHERSSGETALDRVVSSYSSSIRAMIHGRQQKDQDMAKKAHENVVLIAMDDTPGKTSLQYAKTETNVVGDICNSMQLQCIKPEACREQVLAGLKNCKVFHFAGHGHTNLKDPLQSQLILKDWTTDPMTIGNVLETNLSSGGPFLAYLSACGTGQILDVKSVDESTHLISAFQLAGFRHVIGTMWEVDDELCVHMARLIYEYFEKNGIDDKSVAYALHYAAKQLRDEWVEHAHPPGQARNLELIEEGDEKMPLWIPYVHYGV